MIARSPGEPQLIERELAETPEARAARRANDWFVNYRRIWAASERAGMEDEGDRVRFICSRLWPDLSASLLDVVARRKVSEVGGMTRPDTAEAIVGERLATLMREHGYRTA
jgi:hypothetical protein